ncbi:MAG: hypothetical protein MI717_13310 [Spirochaetales bacterium]|nr:hypothetical protein [Spirochaetales bacterium]
MTLYLPWNSRGLNFRRWQSWLISMPGIHAVFGGGEDSVTTIIYDGHQCSEEEILHSVGGLVRQEAKERAQEIRHSLETDGKPVPLWGALGVLLPVPSCPRNRPRFSWAAKLG